MRLLHAPAAPSPITGDRAAASSAAAMAASLNPEHEPPVTASGYPQNHMPIMMLRP